MVHKFSRALYAKLNSQLIHKNEETEKMLANLAEVSHVSKNILDSIGNDVTIQLNLNQVELNVYEQIRAILIYNCNPELAIKQIGADENYKGLMLLYFDIFLENKTITQTLLISHMLHHISALQNDNPEICVNRTGASYLEDVQCISDLGNSIRSYVEQQCAEEIESSNAIMISSMMLEYKSAFLAQQAA